MSPKRDGGVYIHTKDGLKKKKKEIGKNFLKRKKIRRRNLFF